MSVTPILMKCFEKLVRHHIKDYILAGRDCHKYIFEKKKKKDISTSLTSVFTHFEKNTPTSLLQWLTWSFIIMNTPAVVYFWFDPISTFLVQKHSLILLFHTTLKLELLVCKKKKTLDCQALSTITACIHHHLADFVPTCPVKRPQVTCVWPQRGRGSVRARGEKQKDEDGGRANTSNSCISYNVAIST